MLGSMSGCLAAGQIIANLLDLGFRLGLQECSLRVLYVDFLDTRDSEVDPEALKVLSTDSHMKLEEHRFSVHRGLP